MQQVIYKQNLNIFLLGIFCVFAFSQCGKNKTNASGIKEIEDVSEKAEELSTKAVSDTTYLNSDEYLTEMQQFDIALSKKTSGLENNERLLIFFESSLRMLKQYSIKVKENPSLINNKRYMQVTEQWGSKVRDYYQILQKTNLSLHQKEKFEYLNKNFDKL
ncbi:MAG: hypothetical protein H6Q20_1019 [Bacteroidetes bacterium]|nr:hypothetical protein [Bacteroidota bacterium]